MLLVIGVVLFIVVVLLVILYWPETAPVKQTFVAAAEEPSTVTDDMIDPAWVKDLVRKHTVLMFSKTYCPACKSAKKLFSEIGKQPFVIELDKRDDGPQIQELLKSMFAVNTVPQIFIDGEHIGGSDKLREWVEQLS